MTSLLAFGGVFSWGHALGDSSASVGMTSSPVILSAVEGSPRVYPESKSGLRQEIPPLRSE
jgi:hypothetical protein